MSESNTIETLIEPEIIDMIETEVETEEADERVEPKRPRRRRVLPNRAGMTLVEIMIVLTILAGIMVAVGVYAFDALDKAKIKQSKLQLNKVSNKLQEYYAFQEPNALPDDLNNLVEPPGGEPKYLKPEDLKDAWGNDIIYNKNGNKSYELRSPGPDASDGSEDDITVEE